MHTEKDQTNTMARNDVQYKYKQNDYSQDQKSENQNKIWFYSMDDMPDIPSSLLHYFPSSHLSFCPVRSNLLSLQYLRSCSTPHLFILSTSLSLGLND